jgi:hypothetical protein
MAEDSTADHPYGGFTPEIIEKLREAHQYLEDRQQLGKVRGRGSIGGRRLGQQPGGLTGGDGRSLLDDPIEVVEGNC